MKKKLVVVAAVLMSMGLSAQIDNEYLEMTREILKVEKKAAVAEAMQLSDAESQTFWTLYNEYQSALYLVQNKRVDIIRNFSSNYESISDEKADDLMLASMKYEQELQKLKGKYYKKFKKILPAGKAARFMQLENKIETLVDARLALEIPLIDAK